MTRSRYILFVLLSFPSPFEPFETRTSIEIIGVTFFRSISGRRIYVVPSNLGGPSFRPDSRSTLKGGIRFTTAPLWNWQGRDFASGADLRIKPRPLEEIFSEELSPDFPQAAPEEKWSRGTLASPWSFGPAHVCCRGRLVKAATWQNLRLQGTNESGATP